MNPANDQKQSQTEITAGILFLKNMSNEFLNVEFNSFLIPGLGQHHLLASLSVVINHKYGVFYQP
jgi:hypothetical protein